MSDEQVETATSWPLNAMAYPARIANIIDNSQVLRPNPSTIRKVAGRFARQGYGILKLATAPREALLLNAAAPETTLGRLVAGSGRRGTIASRPFVCASWPTALRLRRMIDHCDIVDRLGHPFDIHGDQYVEIAKFPLDGEPCRLLLDRPRWLACDGMLCLSLWTGIDRVFSVSFCLADDADGRTAYVGGIQGHGHGDDALDRNRLLTRAAHGMRPRDLTFELFRTLAPGMGVDRLKCISDACRYQQTRRAAMTIGAQDKVLLDYDEIWQTRGGQRGTDGFFLVPLQYFRHDLASIPAKKRGLYRKRYAMLDELAGRIADALALPCVIHHHAPRFVKAQARH